MSDTPGWEVLDRGGPFCKRCSHAVVVFNDSLYLAGGHDEGMHALNDIWKSNNATAWTEVSPEDEDPMWSKRSSHVMLEHNGALLVLGGYGDDGSVLNDVWRTSDGMTWSCITEAADWSPRLDCN